MLFELLSRYYRLAMKLAPPSPGTWHRGCVMTAQKGDGHAWMQPMIFNGKTFNAFSNPREVTVSAIVDPAEATFCEPVEKSNSSHTFTAGLADSLGLRYQFFSYLSGSSLLAVNFANQAEVSIMNVVYFQNMVEL